MPILDEQDRKEIAKLLETNLGGDVKVRYFPGSALESNPEIRDIAQQTHEVLNELSAIDGRIKVEELSSEDASKVGFTAGPAFTVEGKAKGKVRYLGAPAGGEFAALLADLADVSKGTTRLSQATRTALEQVAKPVHIRVFVTPTWPYCPAAARLAHQMAVENSNITADTVECQEFPELAEKFQVSGVPKIVVNDTVEFVGAQPEPIFLKHVLRAAG